MIWIDTVTKLFAPPGYWYVATPYTRYQLGHRAAHQYASRISAALVSLGIPHFCPVDVGHRVGALAGIDPYDPHFWPAFCQPAMERAHGMLIVKLTGWDVSEGIRRERDHFDAASKLVYAIDPADLLGFNIERQLCFEGLEGPPMPRLELEIHAARPPI